MVLNLFGQLFWSFALVYLVCNFGHKVSAAFEDIECAFDQISWYLFPYEMWQRLPIIVAAAQQPAELTVFGSISCSREDFKKVSLIDLSQLWKLIAILFHFCSDTETPDESFI